MLFYHQGTEKELEKIITNKGDDPYFYDAYQGIKDVDLYERKQIASGLKTKLDTKVKANRKIGMPLLKAVASVAILGALGLWFFNLNEANKQVVFEPTISNENVRKLRDQVKSSNILNDNQEAVTESSIQGSEANYADIDTTSSEQIAAITSAAAEPQIGIQPDGYTIFSTPQRETREEYSPPKTDINSYQSKPPATSDGFVAGSPNQKNSVANAQSRKDQNSSSQIASTRPEQQATKTKKKKETQNKTEREQIIAKLDQVEEKIEEEKIKEEKVSENAPVYKDLTGFVTDLNGEPLFGVTVIAERSMNGTSTDFNGKFSLKSLIVGEPILFSYIGYEDVNTKFSGTGSIKVKLKNQTQLSETIVSSPITQDAAPLDDGSSTITKPSISGQSNEKLKFAKPASGWKTFKNQLERNMRYPKEAEENEISGRVIISFFVDRNGQLSDFQVKKSLGYGCDEEAIRMLRNGPPWDAGATNTRAEYTFRFK